LPEPQHSARRFAGRTVLITGASRGIGKAAALAFAREGAKLILLARTRGGLEDTDDAIRKSGSSATLVEIDLRDGARLDALGPSLFERFGHLDVLIANAGILGTLSPLPHITDKDWTDVLAINLTANWRLIRTLDPLLRRAEAARALFLTSGEARSCTAYWGPYAASKAALEALVKVYAGELASTPMCANLLDPGVVRTQLRAKAMPGEDPNTVPDALALSPIILAVSLPTFTSNGLIIQAQDHDLYPPQFRRH